MMNIERVVLFQAAVFLVAAGMVSSAFGFPVPDNGPTLCFSSSAVITCPQSGDPYYGQDGSYILNQPSYTKLDASGSALPDSAATWSTVRDNVTGLTWEVKAESDSTADLANPNDPDNRYTWCDTNGATNSAYTGTCGAGNDTEDFIAALNASSYGGFSDWRFPTLRELSSLNALDRINPAIQTTYFQNTLGGYFWTSTSYAVDSSNAWNLGFYWGDAHWVPKTNEYFARAVRGGLAAPVSRFRDNGDGTITDIATGLMWQRQDEATTRAWADSLSYCEDLTLAGYDDWRLPTREELRSLVDYSRSNPSIDSDYFPNTASSEYWSSTTLYYAPFNYNGNHSWRIRFDIGIGAYFPKTSTYHVRAVRGGRIIPGDVDLSGYVDLKDVILSLQAVGSSAPVAPVYVLADVNSDQAIGVEEAVYGLQVTSGSRQ